MENVSTQKISEQNESYITCSERGAPESMLWLATFCAITLASVSRTILPNTWF